MKMATLFTERITPKETPVSAQATQRIYETDPSHQQYVWRPQGLGAEVRINAEVIERLERESVEIFRAITNRGSEIGGILLGHVLPGSPRAVIIEDFEAVECGYNRGPRYLLSEEEQQVLKERLANRKEGLGVVGFFRSNTRSTLGMQEDDVALFDDLFGEENSVFMMAKPFSRKPSQGSIFIREAKGMKTEESYLDFVFSKAELEKRDELEAAIRVPSQPAKPPQTKISVRVKEMGQKASEKPVAESIIVAESVVCTPEVEEQKSLIDVTKLEGLFRRASGQMDASEEQQPAAQGGFSFSIENQPRSKRGCGESQSAWP